MLGMHFDSSSIINIIGSCVVVRAARCRKLCHLFAVFCLLMMASKAIAGAKITSEYCANLVNPTSHDGVSYVQPGETDALLSEHLYKRIQNIGLGPGDYKIVGHKIL